MYPGYGAGFSTPNGGADWIKVSLTLPTVNTLVDSNWFRKIRVDTSGVYAVYFDNFILE